MRSDNQSTRHLKGAFATVGALNLLSRGLILPGLEGLLCCLHSARNGLCDFHNNTFSR
jgi:hypothetical protein